MGLGIVGNLVFLPLYLRYLGLAGFGAWSATGAIVAMVGILDGGLTLVLGQRLARTAGAGDRTQFAAVAGTGWALLGLAGLLIAVGGVALAPAATSWLGMAGPETRDLARAFAYASVGTGLAVLQGGCATALHARQRPGPPGVVALAAQAVGLVATVGGLVAGLGVVAMGAGVLARGVVGSAGAMLVLRAEWARSGLPGPRFTWGEVREQLASTGPMLVGRAGATFLAQGEVAVAAALVSPDGAGVLAITSRAFLAAQALVNPAATAVFSGMAHLSGSGDRKRLVHTTGEVFRRTAPIAALVFGVAMIANPSLLAWWTGQGFGGLLLNCGLGVAGYWFTRFTLLGAVVSAQGMIISTSYAVALEAVARVVLLMSIVPHLGLLGLPLSALAASAVTTSWLLTGVLARNLGVTVASGMRIFADGTLGAILVLSVAGVTSWLLPVVSRASAVIAYSIMAVLLLGFILIAVDREARSILDTGRETSRRVVRAMRGMR